MNLLEFDDVREIVPEANRRDLVKLNEKLETILRKKGFLKECVQHIPRFLKLAAISSVEFELSQYGYLCEVCEKRIFPVDFELFDHERHSGLHIRRPHARGTNS